MLSIPSTSPQAQEQLTTYRYVSRLTPERVRTLTPEQKEQALLEFLCLFTVLLSVLYNPLAKEATRLLALDVIITQVQRSARKLIGSVTDKSPTYAAETGKRLGLSKNTISGGYKRLEQAGVLTRSHRTNEATRQEHLDIQPTKQLFTEPSVIRDKTKRAAPKPKPKTTGDSTKACLECGSPKLRVSCRECGSVTDLGEAAQPGESKPETEKDTTHHKSCDVTKEAKPVPNNVTEEKPPTPPEEAALTEEPKAQEEPDEPGQSHLIFGTGSTSCIVTSQLSKLCSINARCKALENLDAIALPDELTAVTSDIAGERTQGGGAAGFLTGGEHPPAAGNKPPPPGTFGRKQADDCRGLAQYCSQCNRPVTWYGAECTPYCAYHWQEKKTREGG